ncbi:hypothetical protein F5Y12DRAFT_70775 [Xylaria sp. FL1777]|nr:hypothetical protein F5Y12DRAFT_70775 [Xylaria sp. FL1777]
MPPSTTFHLFNRLPREIQDMVWRLHRERRGIRHYLTESQPATRHYAAIDIETNLFAQTLLTKRVANTFWDENDRPIRGESDAKIQLIGVNYVSQPGDFAKSVSTAKYPVTWRKVSRPQIRINYTTDVVVLEGVFVCLRPVFRLQHALPIQWTDLLHHWLRNVQYLAVNAGSCRMGIQTRIATLPALEQVYLVIYRDPECRYGAPRHWRNFDKSLLDTHNFLPFDDFVNLHPSNANIECDCETNDFRALEVRAAFRRAFLDEGQPNMSISIVADPY